jgi:multimeric flavodoxin WrbA
VKQVLIVYYTQHGGSLQLATAAETGAKSCVEVAVQTSLASHIKPSQLISCDGLIICSPEYFGAMAGQIKDLFDRCFYPCESQMQGKALAVMICAGNDGRGAAQGIERLTTGWRMKPVAPSLIARRLGGVAGTGQGELSLGDLAQAHATGQVMAEGLHWGIF